MLRAKTKVRQQLRDSQQQALEMRELNVTLEKEVKERWIAQQDLQDLNAKLEVEAAERTAAEEALRDLNAELEIEAAERLAVQEELASSRDAIVASERQLRQFSVELQETNKELISFANSIAHDFRAPMVNIKGFSRELKASLADIRRLLFDSAAQLPDSVRQELTRAMDQEVPDSLNFILSGVDRLDRMVNALLGLARLGRQELVFEDVEMLELVNRIFLSFRHQIETDGIKLTVDLLPVVRTSHQVMERIVGNLVDNAVKYLVPGRPGQIAVSCREEDEQYVFCVRDNGRGVAGDELEKIFQVFRRVGAQDVPGDGLGLAYVRTLARQLGGRVWCESELGISTKMFFSVPKQLYS